MGNEAAFVLGIPVGFTQAPLAFLQFSLFSYSYDGTVQLCTLNTCHENLSKTLNMLPVLLPQKPSK